MDTGSQPVGMRPRTSEGVHLPVQWRRSSPEPAAAASAPLVDCPWTASVLPGSKHTGQGQKLITSSIMILTNLWSWPISFIHPSTAYITQHVHWQECVVSSLNMNVWTCHGIQSLKTKEYTV